MSVLPVHISEPLLRAPVLRGVPSGRFGLELDEALTYAEACVGAAEVHGLGCVVHVVGSEPGPYGSGRFFVLTHVESFWCQWCTYGGGIHEVDTWECEGGSPESATATADTVTAAHEQTRGGASCD